MQIKIVKEYKKLKVGDTPNVTDAYALLLIKKGVATNGMAANVEEKKESKQSKG